jgi:YHS domain-containing protein
MAVEREKAADRLERAGVTYYFCSRGCRAESAADPARLLD